MPKRIIFLFSIVLISFSLLAMDLYIRFVPIVKQGMIYNVAPGTSKKLFLSQLQQAKLISYPFLYLIYLYLPPQKPIKKGEYYFPAQATFANVWQQVTSGKGLYYRPFTIIPGMTFKQIKQNLLATPGLKAEWSLLNEADLLKALHETTSSVEGLFLPETYFYTKGESDKNILKAAHQLLKSTLAQVWLNRKDHLPYTTPYQALIAASLIEKEAQQVSELPRIAGVLVNRLRKDMLLQFDPTVIYSLGDRYAGKINKSDLNIMSAHNTYVHRGLPPTPIAMPSKNALTAALHPETHDYYYFVARGDGSHIFSKNLTEHNEVVKKVFSKSSQATINFFNLSLIQYYLAPLLTPTFSIRLLT